MHIEIFDRKKNAATAAKRWKSTYFRHGQWSMNTSGPSNEIYDRIIALGDNPDPGDVDRAIGNESWTQFMCSDCYEYSIEGVFISADDDREISLCASCKEKLKSQL